jgi:hypothetical protein
MSRILPTKVSGRRWRGPVVAMLVAIGSVVAASPAWAHEGDGESTVGYQLVQQALGHLSHDTSQLGIELAMEKVDDALATTDQAGMDVAEVEQGRAALDAGEVVTGRILLQQSIAEAVSRLAPATGDETGTSVVLTPLPGRGALTAMDRTVLAASALLLLAGIALAVKYRPHDSVRVLQRRLGQSVSRAAEQPGTTKDVR